MHLASKLVLCCLVAGRVLIGAEVGWIEKWEDAATKARDEKRPLFIYVEPKGSKLSISDATRERLNGVVALKVPVDYQVDDKHKIHDYADLTGLRYGGFALMNFAKEGATYGRSIGAIPYASISYEKTNNLLDKAVTLVAPATVFKEAGLDWYLDYATAYEQAKQAKKNLVLFVDDDDSRLIPSESAREIYSEFVLVRMNAKSGALKHDAFGGLRKGAGVVVINLAREDKRLGFVEGVLRASLNKGEAIKGFGEWAKRLMTQPALEALGWESDYSAAFARAKAEKRRLLVAFETDRSKIALASDSIPLLATRVLVRVPIQTVRSGTNSRLIATGGFTYLSGEPGIAEVELADEKSPHYGNVIGVLPFRYFNAEGYQAAFLGLPDGTVTQRMMIWAVRTHGSNPQSANGYADPNVLSYSQAKAQAISRWFDHNAMGGSGAEIIAMNQHGSLIEGCRGCVQQWRDSGGHWNLMRQFWQRFGYDIFHNGHGWYGVGNFR